MAQREYIDRPNSGSGMAMGAIIGVVLVVALAVIVALFLVTGGTNRFASTPAAPNTTNVNVPAAAPAPQPAAQPAPQINVPRNIDVNINQPPAAAPAR